MRGRLLLAMLAGPVAGAADMMTLYVLAAHRMVFAIHVSTVVFLVIAIAATVYAARLVRSEERFLAVLASVLGAFFALLILAFEIPNTILRPTD